MKGLPVKGYTDQHVRKIDEVNSNKNVEEMILRELDRMANDSEYDGRWVAIARTHIETGFMAMNRAVFRPERVELEGE